MKFNLYKLNTCLFQLKKIVPRMLRLERLHCVCFQIILQSYMYIYEVIIITLILRFLYHCQLHKNNKTILDFQSLFRGLQYSQTSQLLFKSFPFLLNELIFCTIGKKTYFKYHMQVPILFSFYAIFRTWLCFHFMPFSVPDCVFVCLLWSCLVSFLPIFAIYKECYILYC